MTAINLQQEAAKHTGIIDAREIQRAFSLLADPGQVVEIRVLHGSTQVNSRYDATYSGYFDDAKKLVQQLPLIKSAAGIYLTLHPVHRDLFSRAANQLVKADRNATTADKNIIKYNWLFIDCDPERVSGVSSTDSEHDMALDHSSFVKNKLSALGWPEPIRADSGNGAHLLYRIDLPVTDVDLVKRVLAGLGQKYDREEIHIDQAVFTPARICKLYGTLACKGSNTADRPHRMSRLLDVPQELISVSREQLEEIAIEVPAEQPRTQTRNTNTNHADSTGSKEAFTADDFIQKHHIGVKSSDPYSGGTRYLLEQCAWNPDHKDNSACIYQFADGRLGASCSHNSCSGKGWKEFRVVFEPDAYTKRTKKKTTKTHDDEDSEGNIGKYIPIGNKPEFLIQGQMRDQVKNALGFLRDANQTNPKNFVYLSMLSEIASNENGEPIIMQVDRSVLRNRLNDIVDFVALRKTRTEGTIKVDAHPPKDLADQILALAPNKWPVPPLKALVEAPVLRPDGSILDKPGYDPKTRLYYAPSKGLEQCKIPTNPTKDDAIKSMEFIKKIFADFPFEGQPDRANTIALLFTPFVRYAVKGDIQMALVDATNSGTGKGLITIVVSIIATGKKTTPMAAKQSEDEWRKSILTELLQAPRIVIIDNIRGILESAALEAMFTGDGINERILGLSKAAKPTNEATWIATGNNLLIGGDLPRRSYRIRLISNTATPEERDDFKIKDLQQWAFDNRNEVIEAILTVARAWYLAGKPQPKKVPNLGLFTNWAKTVGGMLEFAGVEDFQGNRADLRSKNNEEAQEWEAFLSTWHELYKEEWKNATDVAEDLKSVSEQTWQKHTNENTNENKPTANTLFEVLPRYLKKALAEKPKSFAVTLPIQLGKRVQTVYGPNAYRIEKGKNTHTGNKEWRVLRWDAVGTASHAGNENETQTQANDNDNVDNHMGHGCDNPPHPTANTSASQPKTQHNTASQATSTPIGRDFKKDSFAVGSNKKSQADTPGKESYSQSVDEPNDDEEYEEVF